jgi:predicted XRE-type DNA-binding protein
VPHKRQPRGTKNALADLGFSDAPELAAKAILAVKLNALLDQQCLSQVEAAKILEMPQPKISAIRNYKLQGISLERMMQALTALGQHVQIVVTPATRRAPAGINVAA